MSVGSHLGTSKTQDMVLLAALAVGGYVLYKLFTGVSAVASATATAYTSTVNALSSGLYAMFGPNDDQALGSMNFLVVRFPDGSKHAVPADTVTSDGLFTWTGYPSGSQPDVTLQLVKDKSGQWFATLDA